MSRIEQIVTSVAARHGCDVADWHHRREATGWVLRVLLDRADGVDVDLCAEVSRDLSAELDVADLIGHAYTLEVSSPGVDRPLKRPQDFRRFRGRQARVRTVALLKGRRNFVGEIVAVADSDDAIDMLVDGHTYTIPLVAIARANLKTEI